MRPRLSQALTAVACVALVLLIPPYYMLAQQTREIHSLREELDSTMRQITVTWPDGSTTVFSNCTNIEKADNGTWSFTGLEGDEEAHGDYSIGHGQYRMIKSVPQPGG